MQITTHANRLCFQKKKLKYFRTWVSKQSVWPEEAEIGFLSLAFSISFQCQTYTHQYCLASFFFPAPEDWSSLTPEGSATCRGGQHLQFQPLDIIDSIRISSMGKRGLRPSTAQEVSRIHFKKNKEQCRLIYRNYRNKNQLTDILKLILDLL